MSRIRNSVYAGYTEREKKPLSSTVIKESTRRHRATIATRGISLFLIEATAISYIARESYRRDVERDIKEI
jgi:hypothetical protein